MSNSKFWVVWQPESGAPHRRHDSLESAQAEAERLAEATQTRSFYVMEAISVAKKISVVTTKLTDPSEELPF